MLEKVLKLLIVCVFLWLPKAKQQQQQMALNQSLLQHLVSVDSTQDRIAHPTLQIFVVADDMESDMDMDMTWMTSRNI